MFDLFLNSLAENQKQAVTGWTLDGKIILWNQAAETLYGFAASDLDHLTKSLSWFEKEEFLNAVGIVREGKSLQGLRDLRTTKSGETVDVLFQLTPVRDDRGNIAGILEFSETANAAGEQSAQKIQDDTKLALAMAHDLRNSLSALTNIAYLLEHRNESRYVVMMKKQICLCESIVNNFLDLYTGRPPHAERIDVAEVVAEVSRVVNLSHEREIRLNEGPEVHGWVDPGHFRRALMNLLQNAVEAVDESAGCIEIKIGEENRFVRIDIEDNGPGISGSIMEEIFEPLVTTKPKGYGLGLAASRQLIEANQGYIHVRSREGAGSVFSVFLPKIN